MAFNIEKVETVVKQLAAEGIVFTVICDKSPDINIHYRANYDHTEAYVHEGGKDGKPNYEIYLNGRKVIEQEFDPEKIPSRTFSTRSRNAPGTLTSPSRISTKISSV